MTLYHIGYVEVHNILVFPSTIGVTSCDQVVWWLTSTIVWVILGFMVWVLNIDTLGIVIVMVGRIG